MQEQKLTISYKQAFHLEFCDAELEGPCTTKVFNWKAWKEGDVPVKRSQASMRTARPKSMTSRQGLSFSSFDLGLNLNSTMDSMDHQGFHYIHMNWFLLTQESQREGESAGKSLLETSPSVNNYSASVVYLQCWDYNWPPHRNTSYLLESNVSSNLICILISETKFSWKKRAFDLGKE